MLNEYKKLLFLSRLFGGELLSSRTRLFRMFLSRLFGGERVDDIPPSLGLFLSRLFGGERWRGVATH